MQKLLALKSHLYEDYLHCQIDIHIFLVLELSPLRLNL